MVPFAELVRAARAGAVDVPADWGQGRSMFGGLTAALVLARLEGEVDPARRCRSLLTSFVGPVAPGPVEITASVLRAGGSMTHAEGRLVQGGTVRCAVLASFGADRPSDVSIAEPAPPPDPPAATLRELHPIPGTHPAFLQHFVMTWATPLPYSGEGTRVVEGFVRARHETGGATAPWIVAMTDAYPVPVLPMLSRVAPASSVTWALELPRDPATLGSIDRDWRYRATLDSAAGGYAHARAGLWDSAGRCAALSRQTIAVFDR